MPLEGFVRSVELRLEGADLDAYPFAIPARRGVSSLALDWRVTILVGENGSGKSTLLEAIAVAAGFNAEGGSRHMQFATTGALLMAYPGAATYVLDEEGPVRRSYDELEQVELTRAFLESPERFLRHLVEEDD